jgi:hypothetical protein
LVNAETQAGFVWAAKNWKEKRWTNKQIKIFLIPNIN